MKHIKEFSRFAHLYSDYNMIQREVASDLLGLIHKKAKSIVDLGCGSGTFYKALTWSVGRFHGFDLSENMLNHHPKEKNIELSCRSFDDELLFELLSNESIDLIVSSSSLQWSKNLKAFFERLHHTDIPYALALFTSDTFKSLHETAGTKSPLYKATDIMAWANEELDANIIMKKYSLSFEDNQELFRYLKKSGVSGSQNSLSFKETKALMNSYSLDYLEFEVIFIVHPSA
jgi:malonyl-CoA O-methyltransferase